MVIHGYAWLYMVMHGYAWLCIIREVYAVFMHGYALFGSLFAPISGCWGLTLVVGSIIAQKTYFWGMAQVLTPQ